MSDLTNYALNLLRFLKEESEKGHCFRVIDREICACLRGDVGIGKCFPLKEAMRDE